MIILLDRQGVLESKMPCMALIFFSFLNQKPLFEPDITSQACRKLSTFSYMKPAHQH